MRWVTQHSSSSYFNPSVDENNTFIPNMIESTTYISCAIPVPTERGAAFQIIFTLIVISAANIVRNTVTVGYRRTLAY